VGKGPTLKVIVGGLLSGYSTVRKVVLPETFSYRLIAACLVRPYCPVKAREGWAAVTAEGPQAGIKPGPRETSGVVCGELSFVVERVRLG
jgi:hypothetical protein